MKRAFWLLVGLILISSVGYSKDMTPGTISINGRTGLDFSKTTASADVEGAEDVDSDFMSLNLNAEYYFMNNLALGLIFMYDSEKDDDPNYDETYETTSMMVGPQIVYNLSVNEQTSVPVFAAFGRASLTDKYESEGQVLYDEDMSGWAWAVGGGLRYFVTDHLSFDGYIFYDSMSLENEVKVDMTEFAGQVGISIYLGGM